MFATVISLSPVSSWIVFSLLIATFHEASTASLRSATCNSTLIECYDCDSRYIKECEVIKLNSSLPTKKSFGCCVSVMMQQAANAYMLRTCINADVNRSFSPDQQQRRNFCNENLCNKSATTTLKFNISVLIINIIFKFLVSVMY